MSPMKRLAIAAFAPLLFTVAAPAQTPQPSHGEWFTVAPLRNGARTEPGVAALNGKVYVLGGSTKEKDDLSTAELYDPATDAWSAIAPMPVGVNHNSAVAMHGRLYVIGGFSGRPPGSTGPRVHQGAEEHLQEYDPSTDRWRKLAPMKAPRGSVGVAALNDKLHAIGGRGPDLRTVTTHEVYDPTTDQWTEIAPAPTARDHMTVIAVNGRIHVIGGRTNDRDDNVNLHEIYDQQTKTWSQGPPAPSARSGGQFALVGDLIVTYGGETSKKTFEENEAFDLKAGRWIILPPGPKGLHASAGATIGDRIYYPGGSTGPGGDAITDQMLVFRLQR